jgi:serine protease
MTVAVIDTGIAYEDNGEFRVVPDLKGAKFAKGYDFVNDDDHPNDDHGHGTHVAGTIAQRTNNAEGVAGIAFEATLMPIKVLDANGTGSSSDIADAIRWAADHGAKVLNLSLGGGGRSEVLGAAVEYARKKGAVVVCAAGNAGRGVVEYPAAYPGAVAVSAVGPSGTLASYSSWGKEIDIAAPGGDIRRSGRQEDGVLQNTIAGGDPGKSVYAYFQGTSMATPHVAGVAALLFAAGASSPEEVEQALFVGANHASTGAWNEKYGHGILDAKGALQALGGGASKPFWKKLLTMLWALLLWLLARATVPRAARKALKPGLGLLGALALTTLGLFFLPWLGLGSAFAGPIPGWFGGVKANPLFCSALIPLLLTIGFRQASFRGPLTGVALGFAAVLFARLFSGEVAVGWMPFAFLSVPWLLVNGLVSLLLARALMATEEARR